MLKIYNFIHFSTVYFVFINQFALTILFLLLFSCESSFRKDDRERRWKPEDWTYCLPPLDIWSAGALTGRFCRWTPNPS